MHHASINLIQTSDSTNNFFSDYMTLIMNKEAWDIQTHNFLNFISDVRFELRTWSIQTPILFAHVMFWNNKFIIQNNYIFKLPQIVSKVTVIKKSSSLYLVQGATERWHIFLVYFTIFLKNFTTNILFNSKINTIGKQNIRKENKDYKGDPIKVFKFVV